MRRHRRADGTLSRSGALPPSGEAPPARRAGAAPYFALTCAAFVVLGAVVALRRPEDWHVVVVAAGRRLIEGRELYDVHATGFPYPPALALFAAPFALVPPAVARAAYILLNGAALFAFWSASWRLSGGALEAFLPRRVPATPLPPRPTGDGRAGRREALREHAILALGLVVGLRFVTDVLEHQQTDLVVAALATLAGAFVLGGRDLPAAACAGLGAGLKATPALWVVYFLVRRRWAAAGVMVAVAAGVNLLPDLVSAPPGGGWWLGRWVSGVVLPATLGSDPGQWLTLPVLNQSLAGTLRRLLLLAWPQTPEAYFAGTALAPLLAPEAVKGIIRAAQLSVLAAGVGLLAAWPARRHAGGVPRAGLDAAILLLVMVLLSPASSKPHFLVVFLPALCLARAAVAYRDRAAASFLAIAALLSLLSNRSLVGEGLGQPMQWAGAITACAAVLLAGCAVLLARADRPPAGG